MRFGEKERDMITAITFNPALDKTVSLRALELGKVNRVGHFREDLGGKGINMGRILGGFGIDTKHIVVLGEDNKDSVLNFFRKDKMELEYVEVKGHTRTNMVIVEEDENRTTDINEAGVSVDKGDMVKLFQLIDHAAYDSDYLIMGGSLAMDMPVNSYGEIARKYKAMCKVIIDADGEILLEGLKGSPYLIKPNIHELENALGRELTSDHDIIDAAREIIHTYKVTYVLVSMGKEGSMLVSEDRSIRSEAIDTEVVSTVGAGDSMLAGFVFGLEKGMSLKQSLAFGTACSSLTISVFGYPRLMLEKAMEISRKAVVFDID